MNEILLVKHLVELCDACCRYGLLQLDEYNNSSNVWITNNMYAYCFNACLNGYWDENVTGYLKLNRSREELIIITGFELVVECVTTSNPQKSIFDGIIERESKIYYVAQILGAMMECPKLDYKELLPDDYKEASYGYEEKLGNGKPSNGKSKS